MTDSQANNLKPSKQEATKPGFFKRVFTKLDQSMKEKAEQNAQDSCCSGSDGKGGKCC